MTVPIRFLRPTLAAACAVAALAACSPPTPAKTPDSASTAAAPTPVTAKVANTAPAGDYVLDKPHASLVLRVNHLGFSNFTARFARFDAKLKFDPANPAAMTVEANIDPRSLESDNPPAGFLDSLHGPEWLDAGKFPAITFRSTKVEPTGPNTARVTGDLTLHGVTRPVTLETTFNGGYPGMAMDPNARIGFSAKGAFKRSDFGMAYGVPAAGSTMGVGDEVNLAIEAEFTGPPMAGAKS